MVAYYMFLHSDKEKVMSIWNKGKDAGNTAWGQTKNAGNKAWGHTTKASNALANGMANGARSCVSGTKKVVGKLKFW